MITSPPHGDVYSYEGIRAAAGLTVSDLKIEIIFARKGILNLLKDCEKSKFESYFELFDEMDVKRYVCIEDVNEMELQKSDFIENLVFLERQDLARKCHEADFSIRF